MEQFDRVDFTPNNVAESLPNTRFHASQKDCVVEYVKRMGGRNGEGSRTGDYLYCHTHQKLCSKTGWEMGWYSGSDNLIGRLAINCFHCGAEFHTDKPNRRYCDLCIKKTSL